MRHSLIASVSLLALLLLPHSALAWNQTGHFTIALMAYRELEEDERHELSKILKAHPHFQNYLAANRPEAASEEEWAFVRASYWPDWVRPSRPGTPGELFKGPEITRYHRGPWHYVDVPWVPPADRGKIDPAAARARQREGAAATRSDEPQNVLEAIEHNARLLADKSAPGEERAVALAWLAHLVGDVHQPLHACTVYSSAFPAGDRGGNEQAIRANGIVLRLHEYWDDALGTSDGFAAIDFLARQIVNDPVLSPQKLLELKSGRTPQAWAQESHAYAVAMAHLDGRLSSARYAAYDAREVRGEDVPPLPPSYDATARDLSKRRAALASHRLAQQVREALRP